MTITPNLTVKRILIGVGFAAALMSAGAIAQQAAEIMPQPGEVRLSLKMGERNVAFPAKQAQIARETIPFETGGHAVTPEGREAMIRLQEALFRQPGGSLVLVVYGEDESLAFQRAKAVRGELAERHSMDPARIIASGRKATGHQGDLAVVDVYGADPTRCGGCNGATFRTIALDSATMALVTVTPEALPQTGAAPAAAKAAAPAKASVPARTPVAVPPQMRPVQPAVGPSAPQIAANLRNAAEIKPVQPMRQAQAGACPRPKIIIDDYYPGGPIVPCRMAH